MSDDELVLFAKEVERNGDGTVNYYVVLELGQRILKKKEEEQRTKPGYHHRSMDPAWHERTIAGITARKLREAGLKAYTAANVKMDCEVVLTEATRAG